jgi:ATP-dependent Lon protease
MRTRKKSPQIETGRRSGPSAEQPHIDIYDETNLRQVIDRIKASRSVRENAGKEEERQLEALENLANGFLGPSRALAMGSEEMVQRLDALKQRAPSFATIIDIMRREARSSILRQAPMRLTPIIMVGPPGFGKTYTARQLAQCLGVPFELISMNLCDDVGDIVGHSHSWRAAREGLISRTLLNGLSASPLILVDELEKAMKWSHENPSDIWLSLLEPENAAAFTDRFLGLALRADHIMWVGAANSVEGVPAPLLDRALVMHVGEPSGQERWSLAQNVFLKFVAEQPGIGRRIDNASLAILAQHTPRKMKMLLRLAIGFAAERNAKNIIAADLRRAETLVGGEFSTRHMGFI